MGVIDIIKEAIYYPLNDTKGWAIIAGIFLIIGILEQLTIYYPDYSIIFSILIFIVAILLLGVNLTIIKETINGNSEIPMIDPIKNFIEGLKNVVLEFVYYVIPAILVFIISIVAGLYSNTEKFILALNSTDVSSASSMLSAVPSEITNALFISITIIAIIGFVLFVFFGLLFVIAQARLAQTESIAAALNIKEVISKITSIGWANYILFIILLLILIFIVGVVSGLVGLIPYVGKILSSVIFDSYLLIVMARSTGLIYRE